MSVIRIRGVTAVERLFLYKSNGISIWDLVNVRYRAGESYSGVNRKCKKIV